MMMYTSLSQIYNVLKYFSNLSGIPRTQQQPVTDPDPPETRACDMPDIGPHQYVFIDWTYVSSLRLSRDQYIKYAEHLMWEIASKYVPEDIAVLCKDHVAWEVYIEHNPDVDVAALVSAGVRIPWHSICVHTKLGKDQIRRYLPAMEAECPGIWYYLSRFQKLDETLVSENAHKFDWVDGPYFQTLSPQFLRQYENSIDAPELHDYDLLP
jgi:hypothetical protein